MLDGASKLNTIIINTIGNNIDHFRKRLPDLNKSSSEEDNKFEKCAYFLLEYEKYVAMKDFKQKDIKKLKILNDGESKHFKELLRESEIKSKDRKLAENIDINFPRYGENKDNADEIEINTNFENEGKALAKTEYYAHVVNVKDYFEETPTFKSYLKKHKNELLNFYQ